MRNQITADIYSVEIVGLCSGKIVTAEWLDALRQKVDDTLFRLDDSGNPEEWLADDHQAVAFKEPWTNDDIGNPGFILETDKRNAIGCAGALTADDRTGDGCLAAIIGKAQIGSGQHSL